MSDDDAFAAASCASLRAAGLEPERRSLSGDASAPLRAARHDAVVVDLRRDPARGLATLEGLRHRHARLGLLAVLARGSAEMPGHAFACGADDFCLGGDDALELVARLRRLIRLRAGPAPLVVGDLVLDPGTGQVRRGGRLLELSRRQQELLALLMRHAGQVLPRARIEAELALVPGGGRSNLVEVHVHHLRRRLGPGRLLTVRGQGYRLLAGSPVSDATERTLRE